MGEHWGNASYSTFWFNSYVRILVRVIADRTVENKLCPNMIIQTSEHTFLLLGLEGLVALARLVTLTRTMKDPLLTSTKHSRARSISSIYYKKDL